MPTPIAGAADLARAMAEAAAKRLAEEAARRAAQEAARIAAQQAAQQTAKSLQRDGFTSGQAQPQVNLTGGAPVTGNGSTLATENTRDGQVNCLDEVGDMLASDPALRANSTVIFLEDNRPGVEGETGHVVIQQGGKIWDPATEQWTPTAQYLRAHPEYDVAGTASGQAVHDILSAEPGPARDAAIAKSGIDPALVDMPVADDPWTVEISAYEGHNGFVRSGRSGEAGVVAELPVGTELEVLEAQGGWYRVRTPDGQEGWIIASRTDYVRGTATGGDFVLEDGRDGSASSAVAHAETLIGGTGYVNQEEKETYCLGFVLDCYYLRGDAVARCPEMTSWEASTAYNAYTALDEAGKIRTSTTTTDLPEGAIVFFAPTDANGQAGHVAIATGELAPDGSPLLITTGFLGSPETRTMSLLELQEESGTYLGYTTPEIAFVEGTYGGGSVAQETP